jgi:hypothetical protein
MAYFPAKRNTMKNTMLRNFSKNFLFKLANWPDGQSGRANKQPSDARANPLSFRAPLPSSSLRPVMAV